MYVYMCITILMITTTTIRRATDMLLHIVMIMIMIMIPSVIVIVNARFYDYGHDNDNGSEDMNMVDELVRTEGEADRARRAGHGVDGRRQRRGRQVLRPVQPEVPRKTRELYNTRRSAGGVLIRC